MTGHGIRRSLVAIAASVAAALATATVAVADAGAPHPGFVGGGGGLTSSSWVDVVATVVQPDGKILIGGYFSGYGGRRVSNLLRLNPDGTLDPSFSSRLDDGVDTIALHSDSRILVTGTFDSVNGQPAPGIARLHPDGSLDEAFAALLPIRSSLLRTVAQPDGKLIALQYTPSGPLRVVRFNADGSPDPAFTSEVTPGSDARPTVQPDGKIYVTESTGVVGGWGYRPVRLNPDGSRDTTFTIDASVASVHQFDYVTVQTDGRILYGYSTYRPDGGSPVRHLVRLLPDGTLDSSFSPAADQPLTPLPLPDGSILAAGPFPAAAGLPASQLVKLLPDGSRDPAFPAFADPAVSMALLPDGNLLVGAASGADDCAARDLLTLSPSGTVLQRVRLQGQGLDDSARVVVPLSRGRFLAGGSFTCFAGQRLGHLARFTRDGSLDTSFTAGHYGFNGAVNAIVPTRGGTILVAGGFHRYDRQPGAHIVRLKRDGSRDRTFTTPRLRGPVYGLAVQPDRRFVAVGTFTYGKHGADVVRLTPNGRIDPTFRISGAGPGPDHPDFDGAAVALQRDGKILVAGGYSAGARGKPRVFRLNPDGSEDPSFHMTGLGLNGWVQTLAVQHNGKIVVGGQFTKYNGKPARGLVRLNRDGSRDRTFHLPRKGFAGGSRPAVLSIAIDRHGRILAGGRFRTFDGRRASRLVRLLPNGRRDPSFRLTGSGLDHEVHCVALDRSGDVVLAGDFLRYDQRPFAGVLRLRGR